jgi:cytochrome c553
MKRFLVFAAASLSLCGAGAVSAAGSAEAGAAKAVVCQACHGPMGHSANPEWPSLAGIGADYIATQLQNFKDGKRNNPIMMPNAMGLSSEDMADLAAYFDSQTPTKGLEADPSLEKAGELLYRGGDPTRGVPACEACHGPSGAGNEPAKFPALRGQQSVYVLGQLHNYASGQRGTGPNGIMQTIAGRLSEDEMKSVASYVQGLQ